LLCLLNHTLVNPNTSVGRQMALSLVPLRTPLHNLMRRDTRIDLHINLNAPLNLKKQGHSLKHNKVTVPQRERQTQQTLILPQNPH
jgi:hypothetical protein